MLKEVKLEKIQKLERITLTQMVKDEIKKFRTNISEDAQNKT